MNFLTDRHLRSCFGPCVQLLPKPNTATVRALASILIGFVSLLGSAIGQDIADEPMDEMKLAIKVAELQQQLAEPSIDNRDAAEAALIKLGVKTLDYLDPVTNDTLPDTIERLGRIRKALDTLVVEKVVKPTSITLKGNFSIKEAAEKIAEKSGNKIAWPDELELQMQKKIDWEIENVSFWQAMEFLKSKAKLRTNTLDGDAGQLMLGPVGNNAVTVPTDSNGIFQVSVLQVSARRNLESPELDYCGLRLRVRWEPRLAPITLAIPASGVSVIDEFDEKVPLPNPTATFSAAVQPEIPEVEFSIPIGLVDRQVEKINRLEATLKAVMPGRSESFEFRRIGRLKAGHKQSKADVTVSLHGIEKNEELYGVLVKYSFDQSGDALESHMSWIFENPLKLIDKDGKEYEPLAKESAGRNENTVGIRYYFGDNPAAMTLKCETPAAIVPTEVKILLKDIPLP